MYGIRHECDVYDTTHMCDVYDTTQTHVCDVYDTTHIHLTLNNVTLITFGTLLTHRTAR